MLKTNTGIRTFAALAGMVGLGVLTCSCAEQQSNPAPTVQQASSASTAAGLTAPTGPFPRGQVQPNNLPDPTKVGPRLTVISPARGAQISSSPVTITLKADDPDGVSSVVVAGNPAAGTGTSEWTASVPLVPGMNVLDLEATDSLGNRTTGHLAIVHGIFQADDTFVERSVGLAMTAAGLDRVEGIAQGLTGSLDLFSMISAKNPVLDTSLIKANATAMTHDPLRFEIEGAPAGAKITVFIDNLSLDLQLDLIGITLTTATVTASTLSAELQATVNRAGWTGAKPGKQALGLEIDSLAIDFQNFGILASSSTLSAILSPFAGTIENMFRDKLETMILDLANTELKKPLPALDTPLNVSFPNPLGGPALAFDLMAQVDEASGSPTTGLGFVAGFKVTATNPKQGATRQVLSLGRQVNATPSGPEPFSIQLTSDAVNRLLHAAWLTDGIQYVLDGTKPVPAGKTAMNVKLLYPFLPPVRDLAPDPLTPIKIEVSLVGAPLLRIGQNQVTPFQVQVPGALVRVLIDYMDGQPPLELLSARIAADLGAKIVVENSEIKIGNLTANTLKLDVTREAADLADQEIEDFVHALLPTMLPKLTGAIPSFKIPGLPLGLKLLSAKIVTDPGVLTIRADLQ